MPPELIEWLASCDRDPVKFVLEAFDWTEGPLASHRIEDWQMQALCDVRDGLVDRNTAIQLATASGHGIGKSTLVAWLILWAFSTAPDTRGVVTANTEPQLKSKTWAELGTWFNRFLAREFFRLGPTTLLSRDKSRERTWRVDMIAWSEKNPEAFAGLHNAGKRLFVIFDEASAIHDLIWETTEGAMTDADTEILWLVFGNPTRNTGRFKECFEPTGHGAVWRSRQIDSREVTISNKTQIARWIAAYGDDSDFVRVRVKGQFPRLGDSEFISAAVIDAAMAREPAARMTDPVALGVDVARYGDNASVIWARKGRDARTIERVRLLSASTIELAQRVISVAEAEGADGIFVDGGGVGGGVVDNIRYQQYQCYDVQFGGKDDTVATATGNVGEKYANKRAAMWGAMRAWLAVGAIPADPDLKAQLLAPRYGLNAKGEIQLETKQDMRRRGVASPDDADALALTFAYPLSPSAMADPRAEAVEFEYNPFSEERMTA